MRLTPFVVVAVMAVFATPSVGASPQGAKTGPAAADEAKAIAQFNAAISKYMALRLKLRDEIAGPVPNSSAVQLTQASDALAAAIQRARSGARAGNLFVMPVTVVVKRRVDDVVRRENLVEVLANIDDPPVTVKTPAIHLRFPAASQLATMPPSLLAVLPPLPKELEYRIIGDYLVLRDIDAALILDYIPAAVPRKP